MSATEPSQLNKFFEKISLFGSVITKAKSKKCSLTSHPYYATEARKAWAEAKVAFRDCLSAYPRDVGGEVADLLECLKADMDAIAAAFPKTPAEALKSIRHVKLLVKSDIAVAAKMITAPKPYIVKREFMPTDLIRGGYHDKRVVEEINITFELRCYNACSVLLRRVLESLIIRAFDHLNLEAQVRDKNGNYFGLESLIGQATSGSLRLSRGAKTTLPRLKTLGDLAAHNPRFSVRKADLESIHSEARLAIEELAAISRG